MPIGIGKQIIDPILTNEKLLSVKLLASFDSTDFPFNAQSVNGGLK